MCFIIVSLSRVVRLSAKGAECAATVLHKATTDVAAFSSMVVVGVKQAENPNDVIPCCVCDG